MGETGVYTVSLTPSEASLPIDIEWSNGITGTEASFSWLAPGLYVVGVTATNCGGPIVDIQGVEVIQTSFPVWLPLILRAQVK